MQGQGCHLYAADPAWWLYHIDRIMSRFQGTCWTQHLNWKPGQAEDLGLSVIKSRGGNGLSRDPEWLVQGQNSGYQAIGLAYHLGYRKLRLLGFDMSRDNGRGHFFGEHPKGLINCANYETYVAPFRTIVPAEYGMEIINCSRRTALDAFPRAEITDVL